MADLEERVAELEQAVRALAAALDPLLPTLREGGRGPKDKLAVREIAGGFPLRMHLPGGQRDDDPGGVV